MRHRLARTGCQSGRCDPPSIRALQAPPATPRSMTAPHGGHSPIATPPPRRIGEGWCAPTVSGHATATLLSRLTKSRRFMVVPSEERNVPNYQISNTLCITAILELLHRTAHPHGDGRDGVNLARLCKALGTAKVTSYVDERGSFG